jgi:hypothetical protein
VEEPGRSSDSGLPPTRPSQPYGQWRFRVELFPSQRRDRPGFAPGSLAGLRVRRQPIIVRVPTALRLWLPVVAWAGLIFALSSVPDLGTGLGGWDLTLRKLAHAGEYAVLGALLLRALRRGVPAFALGVAYAISDEVHQHFVPGRRGAPLDVLIDAVGVGLGVLAWRRFAR